MLLYLVSVVPGQSQEGINECNKVMISPASRKIALFELHVTGQTDILTFVARRAKSIEYFFKNVPRRFFVRLKADRLP